MPKKTFTDSEDERLIDSVRSYRELYDHEDKEYRNAFIKNTAWRKVAGNVGQDVDQCKRRWKDVKDNYFKILRKVRQSAGSSPSPTVKWPLFNRLQFLNYVSRDKPLFPCINQEETSNLGDPTSDEEMFPYAAEACLVSYSQEGNQFPADSDASDVRSLGFCTSGKLACRRRQAEEVDELETTSKRRFELLDMTTKKNEDDDVDLFMKSIALSVKKLPPHLINQAKMDILKSVARLEEMTYPTPSFPTSASGSAPKNEVNINP